MATATVDRSSAGGSNSSNLEARRLGIGRLARRAVVERVWMTGSREQSWRHQLRQSVLVQRLLGDEEFPP